MILEEDSIVVRGLTDESAAQIKTDVTKNLAAGNTVTLASLGNVTAYEVDKSGKLADASGKVIPADMSGMNVVSVEAEAKAFVEEIAEIQQAEAYEQLRAEIAAAVALHPAAEAPAVKPAAVSTSTGGCSSEPSGPPEEEEPVEPKCTCTAACVQGSVDTSCDVCKSHENEENDFSFCGYGK